MKTKIFGEKKIVIRKPVKSDLKNAKKFQNYINSLVGEEAKLLMNKKTTVKEEIEFIEGELKGIKNKTKAVLMAECDGKIVGFADIKQDRFRKNHVGIFGISIRDGYRGIGLGKYLMSEVIKLAKLELKPRLKIVQLTVYTNNATAISLYKKMGFKIVAKLPKQIQWKGKLIDEYIMLKFL